MFYWLIRLASIGFVCAVVSAILSPAPAADLDFKPADRAGYFDFDTGVLKGTLRLDGKLQGIDTLVHVPSGLKVTYGGGHAGLLSHYRVFSATARPTAKYAWPRSGR